MIWLLIAAMTVSGIGAGILAFTGWNKYRVFRKTNEALAEEIVTVKEENAALEQAEPEGINKQPEPVTEKPIFPIEIDFPSLLGKNQSVIGWLYSEGTVINYPVVIGSDNLFYLYHDIRGNWNDYGTIFADAANSGTFRDANTILYAHHMQDGSMFASMCDYKSQDYYDKHPCLWLAAPDANYRIDIFACYVTEIDSEAYTIRFAGIEQYGEWLRDALNKSLIKTDIVPNVSSRIVTFSTCSYEFKNARTVVLGVLTDCEK